MINNLSKTFRYVNALGEEIVFDYDHGFLINKPDGIDTLAVDVDTAQGVGQVGATVQARSIKTRPINVDGKIVWSGTAIKDRLMEVVRPDVSGTFYAGDWRLSVVVTDTPTIGPEPQFAHFQFSVLAAYSYWQTAALQSVQLSGIQYYFKFPWNISRAYRFGERVKALYMNVKNTGQTECPFKLIVKALDAAENVKIENILTGEFLLVEKALAPGEQLTVTTSHAYTTVVSSEDGDCRGALTLDSDLFRLHAGDNILKPSADSGLDNLDISVEFSPERVGVVV